MNDADEISNRKYQYWIKIAEYDIDTAKAMLNSSRFLYVGFMCHQAIEKMLKAIIARDCIDDDIPPKIHDLRKLSQISGLFDKLSEEQKNVIRKVNPLNIEARYPIFKDSIAENLSYDICVELIKETEELMFWIKKRL